MKRFICWVCLFFTVSIANAFNFAEIKSFSRNFALDNNIDPAKNKFNDILISSYVNAGQDYMCNATFCLEGTITYTIVSGQREYNYSSDMVVPKRITLDGVLLLQRSISKLDDDDSWESNLSSSVPSYYYVKHTTYSVIGFDVLPTTTTYTTMSVQYIKKPDQLSADSDIPFDGQDRLTSYHFGLVWWTAALLCYQDNREADGDRFMNLFSNYISNLTVGSRITPGYLPSRKGATRNIVGQD